jgi:hypothetical protein
MYKYVERHKFKAVYAELYRVEVSGLLQLLLKKQQQKPDNIKTSGKHS